MPEGSGNCPADRSSVSRSPARLVLAPRLLLLDEPFSQLDPELRAEMRALVCTLPNEATTTTLFLSHDQAEAVGVADPSCSCSTGASPGTDGPNCSTARPRP